MGKSPLTGYWGDANCGGDFANHLKGAGYDIVFFEGKAEHPVYLFIDNGKVQLRDARHLWGKDTTLTEELIRQELGNNRVKVAAIGPAGERMARIAAVMNDRGRAAARSGLGAVMGSKNLKAVAAIGGLKPSILDKPRIQELMRETMRQTKENPSGMFFGLSHGGTPGAMVMHMHDHDVPIKNWGGNTVQDFPEEKWDSVAWGGMEKYAKKKYACTGCPVGCGGELTVEGGKYPVTDSHKPEYETLAAFGPMCLNDNMEALIYENELCNLYGLDTISAGATVAFAIECYENGIHHQGRHRRSRAHLGQQRCPRGPTEEDVPARGLSVTSWPTAPSGRLEKIGRRSGEVRHARGRRDAGHARSPLLPRVGGDLHLRLDSRAAHPGRHGLSPSTAASTRSPTPAWACRSSSTAYDPTDKGEYHALLAGWQHWVNTSGACLFGIDSMPLDFLGCMKAITGWDLDYPEIVETGHRITTLLHGFNLREGFKPADFQLPERARGNPPLPVGELQGVTIDSEGLKGQFYEAMGFDRETGAIAEERIAALGLGNVLVP